MQMNIYELKRRYMDDPLFNRLVQQMMALMETVNVRPYEVRDAAFLAELIYREKHIEPLIIAARATPLEKGAHKHEADTGSSDPT
jgi:hypothetical protein